MKIVGAGLQAFADSTGFTVADFNQRFPWLGADLQTVRNSFIKPRLGHEVSRRLCVPIGGGKALNVAVSQHSNEENSGKALVLVHGLGGSESSSYMENTAQYFYAQGWHVYRMNYRGVGASRETSVPPYSAGLTGDMRAVLRAVAAEEGVDKVCAMGFSLGGQLLMRTLGEGDVEPKLCAVVTVSAPLDLATSQQKLERRRNALYVRYLVGNMKKDMEGISHPAITMPLDEIRSVLAFDEHVIAPYFGFASAQDYYRCVSCKMVLEKINIPLLAIHSEDDPWIPVEDYLSARWPVNAAAGALLLQKGGHVGFHGSKASVAWFKPAAATFFKNFT